MKKHKIIVGVSGGPDSIFLLNKLYMDNKYELFVIHVNYHLRKESNLEQKKVQDYCKKRNIKLYIYEINKKDWDKVKHLKNKQSMAREQRFNFFLLKAKEKNIRDIFIAHHKDDFLETAVMQKEKSNDFLFYGIKNKLEYKGLIIHRPLLNMYKEEIINYLNKNNISYSLDKTNYLPIYKRNKIRINLSKKTRDEKELMIQEFKKINKSKKELEKKVIEIYKKWEKENFSYLFYSNIEKKLLKYIIYMFLIRSENRINISLNKIEGIIEFLKVKKGNKKFRLMENIFLEIKSNIINIIYK